MNGCLRHRANARPEADQQPVNRKFLLRQFSGKTWPFPLWPVRRAPLAGSDGSRCCSAELLSRYSQDQCQQPNEENPVSADPRHYLLHWESGPGAALESDSATLDYVFRLTVCQTGGVEGFLMIWAIRGRLRHREESARKDSKNPSALSVRSCADGALTSAKTGQSELLAEAQTWAYTLHGFSRRTKCDHLASALRVATIVFDSDSFGMLVMNGSIIHARPKGTLRVRVMASHWTYSPPSRSSKRQ